MPYDFEADPGRAGEENDFPFALSRSDLIVLRSRQTFRQVRWLMIVSCEQDLG